MHSPETAPHEIHQPTADAALQCAATPVPVDGDIIRSTSTDREFAAAGVQHPSPLIAPGPDSDVAVPVAAAASSDDALPPTAPEPGSNLFVAGLAPAVDDAALERAFAKFGRILSAKVMLHVDTAVSRGFGFVLFPTAAEANAALQALDGSHLPGHEGPLQISVSRHRGENLSIDSRVVYVRNLPPAVAGSDRVAQLFETFGTVESVVPRMPSANSTKPPINVVVTFDSVAPAKACVAAVHGKKPFDECTSPVLAKLEEPQSLREQRLRNRRAVAGPSNGPDASTSSEALPQQPEPVGGAGSRKTAGRDAVERQPAGGRRGGKDRTHPPQPHQHPHTPGQPLGAGYASPVAAPPYTPYHHLPQHQHYQHHVHHHHPHHQHQAGAQWAAQPMQAVPWQGPPMFVQPAGVMQAAPMHMQPFVPLTMGAAPATHAGYAQPPPPPQAAHHHPPGALSGPPLLYSPVYQGAPGQPGHAHQLPGVAPQQHSPFMQSTPGAVFHAPPLPAPTSNPPEHIPSP